jgi:hypothetical protein
MEFEAAQAEIGHACSFLGCRRGAQRVCLRTTSMMPVSVMVRSCRAWSSTHFR